MYLRTFNLLRSSNGGRCHPRSDLNHFIGRLDDSLPPLLKSECRATSTSHGDGGNPTTSVHPTRSLGGSLVEVRPEVDWTLPHRLSPVLAMLTGRHEVISCMASALA